PEGIFRGRARAQAAEGDDGSRGPHRREQGGTLRAGELRGSLRERARRDAARQAGGPRPAGAEGGGGARARRRPDGCAARQPRGRDEEEARGGEHAQPRGRRQAEGRTLKPEATSESRVIEGTVAFTGRLASMRRAEAFALVRERGGTPREGVTKKTD